MAQTFAEALVANLVYRSSEEKKVEREAMQQFVDTQAKEAAAACKTHVMDVAKALSDYKAQDPDLVLTCVVEAYERILKKLSTF